MTDLIQTAYLTDPIIVRYLIEFGIGFFVGLSIWIVFNLRVK